MGHKPQPQHVDRDDGAVERNERVNAEALARATHNARKPAAEISTIGMPIEDATLNWAGGLTTATVGEHGDVSFSRELSEVAGVSADSPFCHVR